MKHLKSFLASNSAWVNFDRQICTIDQKQQHFSWLLLFSLAYILVMLVLFQISAINKERRRLEQSLQSL